MTDTPNTHPPRPALILLALATIYLVWGSTYLGIRIAVQDLPPFLLGGLRFTIAGALLYAFARWRGAARPTGRAWLAALAAGVVTFVGAHGALAWGAQHVSSATAALVSSGSPVWIALAGSLGLVSGYRPSAAAIGGITLGLAGVALVVDPAALLAGESTRSWAMVALVASSLAWAAGGLLARWSLLPKDALLTAGMSMSVGGVLLLTVSAAVGEPMAATLPHAGRAAWLALGYLVVFGSVLAYASYVWLLRVDGPGRAAAHSFVNPIVAVALGALVAEEALTLRLLLGVSLVVGGVVLLNVARGVRLPRPAQVRHAAAPPAGHGRCGVGAAAARPAALRRLPGAVSGMVAA